MRTNSGTSMRPSTNSFMTLARNESSRLSNSLGNAKSISEYSSKQSFNAADNWRIGAGESGGCPEEDAGRGELEACQLAVSSCAEGWDGVRDDWEGHRI